MHKKKVAVLYICTGKYIVFWNSFYQNFQSHFLKNSDVHFHVFTDNTDIVGGNQENVHIHLVEAKDWPAASLMRYHFFCDIERELRKYDYCFFLNACMICEQDIGEDDLLVNEGNVLVVEHPIHMRDRLLFGVAEANRRSGFERKKESTACVPFGEEKTYVTGAFNGGSTDAFLKMSEEIKGYIDRDMQNGVLARENDESYLNHYISIHDNYVLLDSAFCHPEVFCVPADQKVMIMEKVNLIDVFSVKDGASSELNLCKKKKIGEEEKKTVLQKMLLAQKNGMTLDKILVQEGYHSIAVFGFKDMGAFLCNLLEGTPIKVKYIIDNYITYIQSDIKLIKEDTMENLSDVDCVIVAHPPLYYRLLDKYGEKQVPPIVSLDRLIHRYYMEALRNKT